MKREMARAPGMDEALANQQSSLVRKETIRKYGALVVLIILVIYNSIFVDNFFAIGTLRNMVIQCAPTMLIAFGMTFVCASGNIDISVGSSMALSGIIITKYFSVFGMVGSIFVGIAAAVLVGAIIGSIIAYLKIQAIIITLTFQLLLRGAALMFSDGGVYRFVEPGYDAFGMSEVLNLPIQATYIVAFFLIFYFIASKTMFGKRVEAIGDNKVAARLSGIRAEGYIVGVYIIIGVMAALAAVISTSRTFATDPESLGSGLEMDAIAAVAIGGTPLSGGRPNITGTLIGVFIIQLLSIMVVMHDLPYEFSLVIKGIVILVSMLAQREKTE